MEQYISKSALVAEIEKKLTDILTCKKDASTTEERIALTNMLRLCKEILSFVNTLKVKEVDLEEEIKCEIDKYYKECEDKLKSMKDNDTDISFLMLDDFAKHFFELGLKAQKDNIQHYMDEIPNYPCDILFVTDVDNIFLFRYMENGRPVDRETPYFHDIQNGKCWYYCNDIVNIH